MAMRFDPRDGELLMFLAGLEPEAELVARLAIGGLSSRCRLDPAWAVRTEALRAKIVGNNEDKLARIMRAAHDMAEEMTARRSGGRSSVSDPLERTDKLGRILFVSHFRR